MIVDDDQKDAPGGFDPRYDPAFQRGYRQQPGERPHTRVRADARTQPAPAIATDREAEYAAEYDAARHYEAPGLPSRAEPQAASADEVLAPAAALQQAQRSDAVGSILDRLDLSPRRNPLMLALWLVAGGFVVVGVVIYSVSVSLSYSGATQSSDIGSLVITQLGWMLAGPLITIGLATLVALLFLTALVGRRTPVDDTEADADGDGRLD